MPLDFATTISLWPTFLCSKGTMQAIENKSDISSPLILWSSGESQFSEGDKFTSKSQGLSWLSISMSKPSSSKQLFLNGTYCSQALNMTFSAESIVLITTSSIFLKIALSSMPCSLNAFRRAYKDHLEPTPSACASVFAIKFGLNLFRE